MSSNDGNKYNFGGWKLTAVIAVLVILAFVILLNPFGIGVEKPDEDMKIAVLLPLSGENAMAGNVYLKGIETAQKELEEWGISYKLVVYDTKGDSEEALRAIVNVHNSGIPVVIGPISSDEMMSVAPYAEEQGIVVLSPGATSQLLEEYNNYTYKLKATDKYLARGFATLFEEKYETTAELASRIQSITVIYDSSLCETTLLSSYLDEVEKAKKESDVINRFNITTYELDNTDNAAAYLLDTKPDCVILFVSNPNTSIDLMKKTTKGGLTPFWLCDETLLLADMSSLGDCVNDRIMVLAPAMYLTTPFYSFEAVETGELPRFAPIQYGYDALMIVNDAIQSNGYSAEAIKNGLDNFRMICLSGTVAFDETKTRYPGYDVLIWRGDEIGWHDL